MPAPYTGKVYADPPRKPYGGKVLDAPPGQLGRQAGLTARNVMTGAMAIPTMIGDAANAAINLPIMGINRMAGSNIPQLQYPSAVVQQMMTSAGLPEPGNVPERIAGAGISAMSGAGIAGLMAKFPSMAQSIMRELASAPRLQALGALTGASAVEGAKESGVTNPLALAGIGMVGGVTPSAGATIAGRAGSGAAQAARPFTQFGRERLVGEALNRIATTPGATAERLERASEIVPGSRPLVSDVARDPGMISAESALRGMDERGVIAQRKADQNAARVADLDRIAQDRPTLDVATNKRNETFNQYARPAFDNAKPLNIGREWINNPILRTIREIRESPAGARKTVRDAMDEIEALVTSKDVDITNAEALYEVRKDLALLRDGKTTGAGKSAAELSNLKNAREQIASVIDAVDGVIESGAPGYRRYMDLYAKRSIPLDQIKALQSFRERAVLAAPDPVTGQDVLSQAKFRTLLRNNVTDNPQYSGRGPGAAFMTGTAPQAGGRSQKVLAKLSPAHIRTLDRIAEDLDRGAATSAGTMKSPGSDTFKNMSVAAVIGRVLGDKTGEAFVNTPQGKALAAPFSLLYRMPEREIQMLMLEAWAEPQLAARLMKQATRDEIEDIGKVLSELAARQATASGLYVE